MARVKPVIKKSVTIRKENRRRRAWFPSIAQDKKRSQAARKRTAARRTTQRNWRAMETREPEIVVEVEPEIQMEMETQAEPPQLMPREELITSLHPLAPDMPMGEEFLASWADVVQGGPSAPSIVSVVMPVTVMAGEMHQLISTPGVQVTSIPITIPVTSIAEAPSIDVQSQLWIKGHQPDEEERIVEMELDQEQEEDPQEGEGSQKEVPQEEDEVWRELEALMGTEEEGSSSEESPVEKTRRGDSQSTLSTLTSEEEEPDVGQPSTSKLKPIPPLVDDTTESAAFDLEDPLGVKAMKAGRAKTTGTKGPKGLRRRKASTPLKRLTPAIKLAKENAHLNLKGSTPSGYY